MGSIVEKRRRLNVSRDETTNGWNMCQQELESQPQQSEAREVRNKPFIPLESLLERKPSVGAQIHGNNGKYNYNGAACSGITLPMQVKAFTTC